MRSETTLHRLMAATTIVALSAASVAPSFAQTRRGHKTPIRAQMKTRVKARVASLPPGTQRPTAEVLLSVGQGELITLPSTVTNVWTSNPTAADVYVDNPREIYLFGAAFGEATVFATNAAGEVVYSTNVRVSQNLTSIDKMMKLAMPEADIHVATAGQLAVITGTVISPSDSAEAQRLVTSLLNPGVDVSVPNPTLKIAVVNRLKTATPLQVNLQVRFAEVSRNFLKNVGNNLVTRDTSNGMQFGLSSGQRVPGTITSADTSAFPVLDASSRYGFPAGTLSLPFNPATGNFVIPGTGSQYNWTKGTANTTLAIAGKLFGIDMLSALDLGESIGQVTTLSQPNLTAVSGETSSFLAGGEIPIPISQGLGAVSVEYKQYGVSLAYTPTVLSDGRISLRVRPEVSELSSSGAVQLNGTTIPALTTRRAETTVELGSGESMMIAGLLSNSHNNSIDKTPGLGDVPVLGALFRSDAFQRNETELVIVITPYLVKPVNANQIALPTDGYKAPDDFKRLLLGQLSDGTTGGDRPKPTMAVPVDAAPTIGALSPAPAAPQPQPQPAPQQVKAVTPPAPTPKKSVASAAPGFGQ